MHRGYIKAWRKILTSPMYKSLNASQRDILWACLLSANHEVASWEWQGEMFECKPGQFVTSLDSLKALCARDTSIRNIRTALVKLEKCQFLANKSTKTGRLISIINWESYQQDKKQPDKQIDKALTKDRQSADKTLTPNKNDKNDKNDKNKEQKISASEPDAVEGFYLTKRKRKLKGEKLEWFNLFWEAFNLPKGKADAADAWIDIRNLNETLFQEILAGAELAAEERRINRPDRPKWAQGWLNARRWEDKPIPRSLFDGVVSDKTARTIQNVQDWVREGL